VLRYDGPTGEFLDVFADIPIAGTDGHPSTVIFAPSGDLLVALTATGNDILRFDGATGAFLGSFIANQDPRPDGPIGMVFGADRNLYVASRDTDEVLRYDGTTGAFLGVFAGGGGLHDPTGLIFVPEPSRVLLAATGTLTLLAVRRRRTHPAHGALPRIPRPL
jgi:DNA-binding beta-propeller fold protein YncE